MKQSSAFDLPERSLAGTHANVTSYDELAGWLAQEIDSALAARSGVDREIRYAWKLYQQERTRSTPPWPGAADLTSPMAREFTDALQARVMQTVFADQVWTVEGWGEAAQRAPFVEEFHQRTLEEERLQTYLDETFLRGFVEGVGILRVSDDVEYRRTRRRMKAQIQTDETGAPIFGEKGIPEIAYDGQRNPVEATDDTQPSVEGDFDVLEPVRVGPSYDVVPYLDQVTLPAHARHRPQVWGEAFRFYRRVPELAAKAKDGTYDKAVVEAIGEHDEQATNQTAPSSVTVADQRGPTAQKELWEVAFLANLDGKGSRWWLATLSTQHRRLLRLKVDDRTSKTVRFIPFPKPGTCERGYSLITDVMRTVIEEDTAVRNMRADKASLAIAAPILKVQGALWDEYEQPFGPRAVITVRDRNELTQMPLSDVPQSINVWKSEVRADADRLVGQNDTSLGVDSGEDNTLGEERLRAGYVEIRISLLIKRLKEPMEELWQIRHEIWKRTLAGHADGLIPVVQRALTGMSGRGIEVQSIDNGRIVAGMLEGAFWGKPRGSVETADLNRQRQNFNGLMQVFGMLMKVSPMFAGLLQQPNAAKSILEQVLRIYQWPDKQAFLGSDAQGVMQDHFDEQSMMNDPRMKLILAMAGGAPGAAPGGMAGAPPPPLAPMPGVVQ